MKTIQQSNWLRSILLGTFLLSALLLASCDSGMSGNSAGPIAAQGGKGCTRVGILMPETTSSTRWETEDRPQLEKAVTAAIPGVHIDYTNAGGSANVQLQQAETDLANGDCMLIVCPHDSVAAAQIIAKARAQNVPVIAYDRMIESKYLSYYVSFDNVKVGELQAEYIVANYQRYARGHTPNIMLIDGAPTDNNALLFSEGVHKILDPLFASGQLNNIYETFTPNWDGSAAQAEASTTLQSQDNNVQIAYVGNDVMAAGVINALSTSGLSGQVLVTGQDATATGVNLILLGEQSMTVYKPIKQEAESTGELVKALYLGENPGSLLNSKTTTYDGGLVPSILDQPITVDSSNVESTVIASGYLTKSQVCMNVAPGTDGVC